MHIDKRMMVITACTIIVGVSAVAVARKKESPSPDSQVSEIIVPGAVPMAEPHKNGLSITVTRAGLKVVVPGCNIEKYADNFFVHVFPNPSKVSSRYANLDFNLASQKGVRILASGENSCVYSRSFEDVTVAEVTVGQFSVSGDVCCKILWSRNYVFDRTAVTGNE